MRETAAQESVAVEEVIDRLEKSFASVPRTVIAEIVHSEYQVFDNRPVRDFVPVLVERQAKKALRERAAVLG